MRPAIKKMAEPKPKVWRILMTIGRFSGCHQMPERSFSFRGYQFPVCARCTGVAIGNLAAIVMFFIFLPHWLWHVTGCFIMFIDWFLQYLGLLESSNARRLITGVIGGYAFTSLYGIGLVTLIRALLSVSLPQP